MPSRIELVMTIAAMQLKAIFISSESSRGISLRIVIVVGSSGVLVRAGKAESSRLAEIELNGVTDANIFELNTSNALTVSTG